MIIMVHMNTYYGMITVNQFTMHHIMIMLIHNIICELILHMLKSRYLNLHNFFFKKDLL